jgi:signal transduction histidine kinase
VFFVYLVLTLGVTMWLIAIPKIPNTAFEVRDFLFLIIFLIIGALLIRIFRERNGLDKIFLAGTLVLVVATIASIVLDLTDRGNDIATPLFQAAMLVELAIFNIGLGVKLKFSLKARQKAQLNLIDQLKKNEALQVSINRQLEMEVQERTEEIQTQNEELVTQQEELAAQRDMLEDQNKIIAQSMNELQQIRAQLEETVGRRTAELKDANSELIQRNDQLEQYAYITAHNLRAPVARLKGLIFLFEKLGGTNSENQEIFEKISASAHEMDDVLTDMNAILEVKTSKQGRKASIKIETALDKVQKTLLQGIIDSSASLNVNLQADEIYGNQSYLESIFYNLLSNSIKYRSAKRPLQVGILTKKEKDQVIIEISDNGIGIDMQRSADKVFKLYQRFHEHSEGKGLGLYLVKTLVEAMGGHISIESKVDVGTRFKIVLPE